jgi:branched-chain amino acid transport system ATP-binding protein
MLAVRDLTVHYGRIAAVRGISLSVDRGELVAIVGPNGAGKTTTLSAIMGVARPTAGDVLLDGVSINGAPPESVVRRGVVLVPEGRRIFGTLTVAENLMLGATARPQRREVQAEVERQLDRFPALRSRLHGPAGRLSGGEQQMLAIARGLMSAPRLLLLDEPSLGLAPMMVERVLESVLALRDEGVTVVLVEQNAHRAIELADRTYVLRTGQIRMRGTREELVSRAELADLYLGVERAR